MIAKMLNGLLERRVGLPLLLALVLVLAVLPLQTGPESFVLHVLFTLFVFAALGHAWNLLAGYCGLLSFGNQVYVGLGGFSMAVGFYYFRMPIWWAWLAAGVVPFFFAWLLAIPANEKREGRGVVLPVAIAIVAWLAYELAIAAWPGADVFGSAYVRRVAIVLLIFLGALPLLRLQGAYFAIATWLIAESVSSVFSSWGVVGAGGGMQIKSGVTQVQLYYVSLALLVVVTATIWRLLRSQYGLALTAVRDDEEAANSIGIDIRRVKMLVFLLSGAVTGLAGGLYYIDAIVITPTDAFNLSWSAYFVFVVVAGGMGTLAGPIVGAAAFVVIEQLLGGTLGGGMLALGVASILLMFFLPRGVMGIVSDLRHPGRRGLARERWHRLSSFAFGTSGKRALANERPGVVAAFLVPGHPMHLLKPDNEPWAGILAAYAVVRARIEEAKPDTLLVYSTQWIAVLDQLWQTRPRISGLHVDENWHEYGTMRYDIRCDVSLALACVKACNDAGIKAKAVDYDGFPIDSGTIVANALANGIEIPMVIASNNVYHDRETTQRLGEVAVAAAIEQGKRVAVLAIGELSGSGFRDERAFPDDRIASAADDSWNRQILQKIEQGLVADLLVEIPIYARDANVDMGFKHFSWLLGCLGSDFKGATTLAYGPAYGAAAAVIEFKLS